MAIWSVDNIVETVRIHKAPYWTVYRDAVNKNAGNCVACADFDNPNLGIEDSCDKLRQFLKRQTAGRYLMTAYQKPDGKRGGISSDIEVEGGPGTGPSASIGSTGDAKTYIEGVGEVSLANIGEAIEKKMKLIREQEAETLRIKNLEEENRRLKEEAREHETGINKGLLSIGSIIWDRMRDTPTGKEVIGMVNDLRKYGKENEKPKTTTNEADAPKSAYEDAEIVGEADSSEAPPEMVDALEALAKDNPDFIKQLQMMAKVKKDNPELFEEAIDNLKIVAG